MTYAEGSTGLSTNAVHGNFIQSCKINVFGSKAVHLNSGCSDLVDVYTPAWPPSNC